MKKIYVAIGMVVVVSGLAVRAALTAEEVRTAAKLYATALLPLAVLDVWRRRSGGAALRFAVICATVVGAIYLPFLVLSPSGAV